MQHNSRKQPYLPQDDPNPETRADALENARRAYRWTENVETLPGVPLAEEVPYADEPSIPWLLDVAEVALLILANGLLTNVAEKRVSQGQDRVDALRTDLNRIRGDYEQHRGRLGGALSVQPYQQQLRDLLAELYSAYADFIVGAHDGDGASELADYEQLFAIIPLPEIAASFMTDETFARMRVAGPNPILLRQVRSMPSNFPVTEAQYGAVVPGDTIAEAIAQGRLYLLNYAELVEIEVATGADKYLYVPLALFTVPPDRGSLVPVAIQCGQDPERFPIFTRASPEWSWQMAKTAVQVAEGNYHELFVHLARTHLMIEPFVVATHRELSARHPINILLAPHFEGTLFINASAAGDLIAPGGAIESVFAGVITSTQKATAKDRLRCDFYDSMLPTNLRDRGVDDTVALPDYPYRDDALLLWNAIADWVSDYVEVYYKTEKQLTDDGELAAWSAALVAEGKVKGFRDITSRSQLVEVLTMVIFTASAQHAAVNYPQATDMSYAPAISGAGWAPAPQSAYHNEADWLKMLPPLDVARQQLDVLYLLGSIYYRPLGTYRSNSFPYSEWLQDPKIVGHDGPLARFRAALSEIETVIEGRNRRRAVPYTFLRPSLVPMSINI